MESTQDGRDAAYPRPESGRVDEAASEVLVPRVEEGDLRDPDAGLDADGPAVEPPRARRRPDPTPTQRALGLLTRREHSRKELTRKLQAKGVAREDAAQAIGRLAEAGWQDDARFAEMLARTRATTGHGPIRIRAELAMHGLDADAIRVALDAVETEVDWHASARDLVRRRIGLLGDLRQRRKAADLLIRRGFDADTVRSATRVDSDDDA